MIFFFQKENDGLHCQGYYFGKKFRDEEQNLKVSIGYIVVSLKLKLKYASGQPVALTGDNLEKIKVYLHHRFYETLNDQGIISSVPMIA